MNVGQLRKAITDLPDDMPVLAHDECGGREAYIYVGPGTRDPYGNVLDGAWTGSDDYYKSVRILLLSPYGAGDDFQDITPESPPSVIDGEVAVPELPAASSGLRTFTVTAPPGFFPPGTETTFTPNLGQP